MKKHLFTLFMLLMALTATKANAFTITATANPSAGGFILGAGNYNAGQTCTLTVQADSDHYSFLNWTENGEIVSLSNSYSFTVEGNRNLVANFVEKHFPNNYHQFPDAMGITAIVFIDDVEQTSPLLEVGAICESESRGSELPLYMDFVDQWMYFLVINGAYGDDLTFKLYDHETQQELDLQCESPLMFDEGAEDYDLFSPFEIRFTSAVEASQTTNLFQGWNWWSTYIGQDDINGLLMLENSLENSGLRIQGKTASVDCFSYQGQPSWYGTLDAITNEQMYKIRTSEACSTTIVGTIVPMADLPITINEGWNWIGFPSDQSLSLTVALGDFNPETNDVIKGRNNSSTYFSDGSTSQWYGGLNTLEPGQGYMYKSNSATSKTLVFQSGRGNGNVEPNITPENNTFVPASANYADNMLITAVVEIDGTELRSEDYELAAFANDECRGSVKLTYIEPLNRYVAFLLVFGDKAEDLHFVLTNGTRTSLSDHLVSYESDGTVGTLTEPITLNFSTLNMENGLQKPISIYPNPTTDCFNVEGVGVLKVEVMDAIGQVILSEEAENGFVQISLGDRATGAYLLRVVTHDGITTKKLVKN